MMEANSTIDPDPHYTLYDMQVGHSIRTTILPFLHPEWLR